MSSIEKRSVSGHPVGDSPSRSDRPRHYLRDIENPEQFASTTDAAGSVASVGHPFREVVPTPRCRGQRQN